MTVEMVDPRKAFGAAVTRHAADDERIVVLSADSGNSSGFGTFQQKYADRYYEFGIQEHGVTGVAAGMATTGLVPVFAAIAPFVTSRNYEAFRNDIGYMRQNVKIVGRNGGMTYSDLGPTHHSLEDYAIMRMIPGVTILSPQDAMEIEDAVAAMLAHEGPVYMRIGGPFVPRLFEPGTLALGAGRTIRAGDDVTIVTTGTVTPQVLDAVDRLAAAGIRADVIGIHTIEPFDAPLVAASAQRTGAVVTVEEHYIRGGLAAAVADALAEVPARRLALGLPHVHVPTGPYDELLQAYGLDAHTISARVQEFLA